MNIQFKFVYKVYAIINGIRKYIGLVGGNRQREIDAQIELLFPHHSYPKIELEKVES